MSTFDPRSAGHPGEEMLVAHASGQTTSGERVVLEAHLAFCTACRGTVAELLEPGGAALDRLAPEPVPDELWRRLEARIAAAPRAPLGNGDLGPLPAAVRAELGPDADPAAAGRASAWRRIALSRIRWRVLHVEEEGAAAVYLIHTRAGDRFPEHVHLGREDVVVLTGAYREGELRTAVGDFRSYPPTSSHAPRVEPAEDCWLVTRIERGVRFTGWRGALQALAGRS